MYGNTKYKVNYSDVPYALESYAYSKSESDSKFALKSENSGGSGEIDWSNINAETISIQGNSGMTIHSNSGIEFGCNKKLTIDVTNCGFNISNSLNVQADRMNFGASTMIEFVTADNSGGVGIWGELKNTKTNSLYITENDLANYATTEYVNTKIGEININDLIAGVLNGFEIESSNRISLYTSNKIDLTAENNVTITTDKDLLLKTIDGSIKIEGSKLYDVNTESYYTTTKDIETQLENYATPEYVWSLLANYATKDEIQNGNTGSSLSGDTLSLSGKYLDVSISMLIRLLNELTTIQCNHVQFNADSLTTECATTLIQSDELTLKTPIIKSTYQKTSAGGSQITAMNFSAQEITFECDSYILDARTRSIYITQLWHQNSSTTITHQTKIEGNIKDFSIGCPVFQTGKVFKNNRDYTFSDTTVNDSMDCIPSVKILGTWREFIGICTEVDIEHNW